MASSLSSLGLGSDGALNYDIIDQLREVDDAAQIAPITAKISENDTKQSDLSILTTYAATLKSSTSSLSSENSYLQRSTSVSGSSVSISTSSGTTIQDFSIDVKNLALNDVYESNSYASESDTFTYADDVLHLEIDGETYDIDVTAGTTLSQLKDKIYDATDGKISASILNVGGDDPYKLILKSTQTGSDNTINISSDGSAALDLGFANYEYTGGTAGTFSNVAGDTLTFTINGTDYDIAVADGDTALDISNKIVLAHSDVIKSKVEDGVLVLESVAGDMSVSSLNGSDVTFGLDSLTSSQTRHIQSAADASFSFNGIDITRSTNSFDDLIVGVNITLNDTGKSNVAITQDTSEIKSNIESFISAYNDLISNLTEATKYDVDTATAGTFQGVSQVVSLKSSINRLLLSVNSDGKSLADFGIALNSSGILELDETIFDEKLSNDSKALEDYFKGYTTVSPTSIKGSAITAGAIDVTSGDLVINDTNIVVSLNGTASENALALMAAVNDANITGIEAVLNSAGTGIELQSSGGYDITVSGDATKLSSLGLKAGATVGNSESTDGIFTKFNSMLADYITGDGSIFSLYEEQLQTKETALIKQRTKTINMLDTKYELMATRFAAYDSIIGKLNTQADSLLLMIEQSYANDS